MYDIGQKNVLGKKFDAYVQVLFQIFSARIIFQYALEKFERFLWSTISFSLKHSLCFDLVLQGL